MQSIFKQKRKSSATYWNNYLTMMRGQFETVKLADGKLCGLYKVRKRVVKEYGRKLPERFKVFLRICFYEWEKNYDVATRDITNYFSSRSENISKRSVARNLVTIKQFFQFLTSEKIL